MATHDVLHGIGVSAGAAAAPASRSSSLLRPALTRRSRALMPQPTARVSVRRLRCRFAPE